MTAPQTTQPAARQTRAAPRFAALTLPAAALALSALAAPAAEAGPRDCLAAGACVLLVDRSDAVSGPVTPREMTAAERQKDLRAEVEAAKRDQAEEERRRREALREAERTELDFAREARG